MTEAHRRSRPAPEGVPPGEPLEVRPFTAACRGLLERGEHALIGVSAGNSYFTQARLVPLLAWAQRNFALVDVLYTDLHLEAMHVADGSPPDKARARANRSVRDVRRRVHRAVEQVGQAVPLRVRALSECVALPGYQHVRRRLDRASRSDHRLAAALDDHCRRVVSGAGGRPGPPDGQDAARHRAALAYLRAELPFLLDTPEVLGVPSSVTCYHTVLPVLHDLRRMAEYWHQDQGHAVVRPRDQDTADPSAGRDGMPATWYDEIAGRAAEIERVIGPYRDRVEIPTVLEAVASLDGAAVLDAGCGSGAYTRLLRRRGAARVVGVDSSHGMVAVAREAEERDPLDITYRTADLTRLEVLGAFDLVTAISVLHYAEAGQALHRMCEGLFANLAPGGRLVAVVGNDDLPSGVVRDAFSLDRPDHAGDGDPCTLSIHTTPPVRLPVRHWSRTAYRQALHACGFTDVAFAPIGPRDGTAGGEPVNLLLRARRPSRS